MFQRNSKYTAFHTFVFFLQESEFCFHSVFLKFCQTWQSNLCQKIGLISASVSIVIIRPSPLSTAASIPATFRVAIPKNQIEASKIDPYRLLDLSRDRSRRFFRSESRRDELLDAPKLFSSIPWRQSCSDEIITFARSSFAT